MKTNIPSQVRVPVSGSTHRAATPEKNRAVWAASTTPSALFKGFKKMVMITGACVAAATPSISHAQSGAGYNIVDAGLFDTSLIGHVVYYEAGLSQHVPVVVENIDVPDQRIEWSDGKGHQGWQDATDFYSGSSVKERKDNTTAVVVGLAAAGLLACLFGGCANNASQQAPASQ